uniref:THO complex subunit 5 homolog isoform X4 n=1 Tax=Petromyzon marinus TaxID=7757 RepID=A0AAJ7TTP2_PETMA|nr:THO complex subunit 5 homolog isoform X4 [Petromyzon marinus]
MSDKKRKGKAPRGGGGGGDSTASGGGGVGVAVGADRDMKKPRVETEQEVTRVYSDEADVETREPEADELLYADTCRELQRLMGEVDELKSQGMRHNAPEIEERKTQVCIHFMTLKKLNRLAHIRCKKGRDATYENKQKVDALHLQLQNLRYEVMHLQKEITKCLEFKSKHEEIELVSVEEFYRDAPPEISKEEITRKEPHLQTLARLDWELEQRKRLTEQYSESIGSKDKIAKDIEVKREHLNNLYPQLNAVLQATVPLQECLAMPFDQTHKQADVARHLPAPLYVLFVQASAYAQACATRLPTGSEPPGKDKRLCVSVEGDVDEAKALAKQTEESPDDESDSDQEEEAPQTKRRRATLGVKLEDKRKQLLRRHPLCVALDISCKANKSTLHLQFRYLPALHVVTVKARVGASEQPSSISGGDLLTPDSLLTCLYPGDHGNDSPNPANRFHLQRLGMESLGSYVQEVGRPYVWVQWLAGLHFPAQPTEQSVSAQSVLSASHMETTVRLLRMRLLGRLALQRQFAALEHCILPVSAESQPLFPAKMVSRLMQWTASTYDEYKVLPYTRPVVEAGLAQESDLYFSALIERGTAKLRVAVLLSPSFPSPAPILSLCLSWNGERSSQTDDNIRAIESEVCVHAGELMGPKPGYELLTNQLARICACLDVYLETWSPDVSVEGPREFPRDKMCLRLSRGPNRLKPFKYNPRQGFFTHR